VDTSQLNIRPAAEADRDAIWNIFHEIVGAGDTYALDPGMSREEALAYWFRADTRTYVAEQRAESVGEAVSFVRAGLAHGTATPSPTVAVKNRPIVGTYILRPNQAGPGAHVANAAYMVAKDARGLGVGRKMAEHSLSEVRRFGFRAIQFNFVVSTNTSAIRLWQQLGFKIVGTLPSAFRHPELGYVDVYVMFRSLL
jgi:ribosomal protein S18 acetylase RimI-like enzyme